MGTRCRRRHVDAAKGAASLFVAQRLDGIEAGGLACRVEAEEDPNRGGEEEASRDCPRRERNRPAEDRSGVVEGLNATGDAGNRAMGELICKREDTGDI